MLSILHRNILFVLFCFALVTVILLEVYIVWAMFEYGFSVGKGVIAALSSGVLAGCGVVFLKLLEANFLKREILPMSRLHRQATERNSIVEHAQRGAQDKYETRRLLVTNTLRFAEETLRGWVSGSHFELCVFVDTEQPLLFGYFDSNHDSTARSMSERERNPAFYVEKGYEVTKLLRAPTSHPRVLKDTHDEGVGYVFTTPEQRKQLRSTFLLCLDIATPCALVVSSNEKHAFSETDSQILSFLRFVGEMVRYDLFEDGFIYRIRRTKPELFLPDAHH
jgi:hypothetical protein